ncbi:hypothetical protein ACHAXT_006886 [Thalassiosira profunda]
MPTMAKAAAPPKGGYDAEYERLLMEELSLKKSQEELLNSPDASKTNAVKTRGMAHRASLEGMLVAAQHAAEKAKSDPDTAVEYERDLRRPEAKNALAALWTSKSRQLEEDAARVPTVIGPDSLAWNRRFAATMGKRDGGMSGSMQPDVVEANADDFFSAYPECRRRDDASCYSEMDESSSDEGEGEDARPKGRKKQKEQPIVVTCSSGSPSPEKAAKKAGGAGQKQPPQNCPQPQKQPRPVSNSGPTRDRGNQYHQGRGSNNSNNATHSSYQHQQSQRQQNPYNGNPYQQQQQRRGAPQNQWQNGYAHNNSYHSQPSGFDYESGSCNSDQKQPSAKANPFRSASELGPNFNDNKRGGRGGGRGGEDWNRYDDNGGANSGAAHYSRNNRPASSAPSRPQQMVQTALRGPKDNISSGLKRKFNNPMKRDGNGGGSGKPSGNNGGQQQRQGNDGGGGGSNDDEELPEELRGCDKELIEKIKNEVVNSGAVVTFEDIAGLEHAKSAVQEAVILPMKRPDLFKGLRACPKGMLLFGPPGTGKTLIAKAIAHESGATFFSISSSSLTSKWIGQGEKMVKTLFSYANYTAPSVVFIDEVDSLLTQRKADENEASRRIKTEFLVQLDGAGNTREGQVLVMGATNRPEELDDAARRRFVKRVYIPLPNESDRKTLVTQMLKKADDHSLTEEQIAEIARKAEGFSGADLANLVKDAAMGPMRQFSPMELLSIKAEDMPPLSYQHFTDSLSEMSPSVAQSELAGYEQWNSEYGSYKQHNG